MLLVGWKMNTRFKPLEVRVLAWTCKNIRTIQNSVSQPYKPVAWKPCKLSLHPLPDGSGQSMATSLSKWWYTKVASIRIGKYDRFPRYIESRFSPTSYPCLNDMFDMYIYIWLLNPTSYRLTNLTIYIYICTIHTFLVSLHIHYIIFSVAHKASAPPLPLANARWKVANSQTFRGMEQLGTFLWLGRSKLMLDIPNLLATYGKGYQED